MLGVEYSSLSDGVLTHLDFQRDQKNKFFFSAKGRLGFVLTHDPSLLSGYAPKWQPWKDIGNRRVI